MNKFFQLEVVEFLGQEDYTSILLSIDYILHIQKIDDRIQSGLYKLKDKYKEDPTFKNHIFKMPPIGGAMITVRSSVPPGYSTYYTYTPYNIILDALNREGCMIHLESDKEVKTKL